jgi:RNA polymerase sigma-70 factor (ECF subfamily)
MQDVYVVVARRLDEFEGRSRLSTWVYGIVMRVAADHRRARARRLRRERALGREPLPEPAPSPEREVLRDEQRKMLHAILDAMRDELRDVFVLAELEQLPGPEIAALLELNPNTMHGRLRAARQEFEAIRVRMTRGGAS